MKCTQCGNKISKGQAVCGACGAAAPRRRSWGGLALVLSILALIISIAGIAFLFLGKGDKKMEGKGFSSPEEAITAYAEALQDGDIGKMVSTFAIESYAEGLDFEEYMRLFPTFPLSAIGAPLPNAGPYQEQLITYSRYATIVSEIRNGYFALIDIEYTPNKYVSTGDEQDEEIEALAEELSGDNFNKELSKMEIGDILTEEELDANEEAVEFQFESLSAYLDVDDLQEVALEIEFDGRDYILYMVTAEIDGRWYNLHTNSPTGNIRAATATTPLLGGFLKQ